MTENCTVVILVHSMCFWLLVQILYTFTIYKYIACFGLKVKGESTYRQKDRQVKANKRK